MEQFAPLQASSRLFKLKFASLVDIRERIPMG